MAHKHATMRDNAYVWFLVHRRELIDQTLETFAEFGISTENVFVGMVQTISRHPERYKKPTLIIFDEAHHATAKTWSNIVNYFEGVPMVGLTATPARLNGDSLGAIFDELIIGAEADWLIANGYLSQYDYYAPKTVDLKTVKMYGADYDQEQVTDVLIESRIYGDVLKYIDFTRKTIIYAPSIRYSKELASRIDGAIHFDGDTPKAERDRIVSQFKDGSIRVLINVNLVGEGFDVPDCDVIMLLRPTQSLALYIQQAMRGMRYKEGKRATIYDFVGNVYRHGMPTEKHDWTLTGGIKTRNSNGEPDMLVRQCTMCLRVYEGISGTCPYCGNENGKTRKEIQEQYEAELTKVEQVEKMKAKRQQGMANSYESLVEIGRQRNYKNPEYWAKLVYNSRNSKKKNI